MKTLRKTNGEMDSAHAALLIALSIGLGLVVHEGFFLVAGVIAVSALAAATVHAVYQHSQPARLAHHH